MGAVIGRADLFDGLRSRGAAGGHMSHSGTWNANPLTSTAGVTACELYLDGSVQKRAAEMGAYLRESGNKVLKQKGISGLLYGRTVIHVYFGPFDFQPDNEYSPPTKNVNMIMGDKETVALKSLLTLHLLQRGIAPMAGPMFIMSAAHREADIDRAVSALSEALDDMVAEGVLTAK